MSISYKEIGDNVYVTNLSAGGILKLQQTNKLDETLIGLDDNVIDLSYLEQGEYYSFSQLNGLTQIHVLFTQLSLGINQDNIDFVIVKEQESIEYLDSLGNTRSSDRIDGVFEKLLELDSLEDGYIDFFVKFSKYSNDPSVKSSLRSKIIKQTGDSNFIAREFGIENFFTIEKFEEIIAEKIKEAIDANLDDEYEFEATSNPDSPTNDKNLLRLKADGQGRRIENFNNFDDIIIGQDKWATTVFKELDKRAGFLNTNNVGTTSIPYQVLKDSELYRNPIRYDVVFPYDITGERQDIYPFTELQEYHDPTDGRTLWNSWQKFWRNIDPSNTTGIDDTILGYYIKFVADLESSLQTSQLSESIQTHFDNSANIAFPYIMNWMVVHYENFVRYNLANTVATTAVDAYVDVDGKKVKALEDTDGALKKAQKAADQNLQGLEGDLEEKGPTEEDIEQRTQLYKQCALLLNMDLLKADFNKISENRRDNEHAMHIDDYYNNRFYMVESSDDNLTIKNKLVSPSGEVIRPFMEITPDIISALKPRLRLYKVYKDNNQTVSFEFPFPTYTDTSRAEIFKENEIDRGDGFGIKSFNFSFDGETPATSQQYISADLTLFFQSFSDFIKQRNVPKGRSDGKSEKFRYADLFVNTNYCPPDLSSVSPLNYDPQYYRLRVDVGWEPRDDDGFKDILKHRGMDVTNFRQAILAMNKSFYLNLVDHEINISDSGTVTISANYIAYIEGLMENNNVLLSSGARELQQEAIQSYEEELAKKTCNPRFLAELSATINAIRVTSRRLLHQSLIEKLVRNKCLYYTEIESTDRKDFAKNKFFVKRPELLSAADIKKNGLLTQSDGGVVSKLAENITSKQKTTTENYNHIMEEFVRNSKLNNMERISFFFMADLVYFLLDSFYDFDEDVDRKNREQIKVILSSFSIDIPFTSDEGGSANHSINIGEIPIEIEVFTKWYKQEINDKELDSISFLEFIKRLTFYLITDIFSEICIDSQQHKRLSFMNAAINSVKNRGFGTMELLLSEQYEGPIININEHYGSSLPLQTSTQNQERISPSDFVQYLLIYPHHRPETHVGRARAMEDSHRGVHHLHIGNSRGILKNASFSKTDIQYLRESRMLTQGENGLLQLSSLYRTNLKMIGNTIFYPGMLLYLNPFGFGGMDFGLPHEGPGTKEDPNLSNIMGIGGYQKVVKVSSTISESGKFETDVECIFEHTGEPGNNGRSPGQRTGRGQQNITKITCADLDKVDVSIEECNVSSVSRDLQNRLRNINKTGNIDKRGRDNDE